MLHQTIGDEYGLIINIIIILLLHSSQKVNTDATLLFYRYAINKRLLGKIINTTLQQSK